MKERYQFGWTDPRSVYGESTKTEKENTKSNVPLWFKLAVKVIYWIIKRMK